MTIDTSWEPLGDFGAQLSAAEDRRAMPYTSTAMAVQAYRVPSSSFSVKKNVIDPGGGALYTGGSSYVPGMPLMVSSAGLASNMGVFAGDPIKCLGNFPLNLAGFDAVERKAVDDSARREDFRKILLIASQPGTAASGAIARKLAEKSLKLGQMGDDRAQVTQDARQQYQKLTREVDQLDSRAQLLFAHQDFIGAEKLRTEAMAKAKLALRFQKVNALATGLTQNAIAQAHLTQRIADAVLAGRPDVAAILGVAYDKLASHSDDMRAVRAQQVAKKQALGGFGDADTDMFERELDSIHQEDVALFSGLRGLQGTELGRLQLGELGRLFKGKVLKKIGGGLKKAAKFVHKVAMKTTVGLACKIERSKLVGKVAGAVGQAVGTFYGGPVGGAVGKRAVERARKDSGSMCDALDKIGITKGEFHKGRVKGALKKAAKDIAKRAVDPKEALKTLTAVGGAYISGGAGGGGGGITDMIGGGGGGGITSLIGGGGGGGGITSLIGGGGGGITSLIGGGNGNAAASILQKIPVSGLIKAATGGKTDAGSILATFSQGGGGDQLKFGFDAFKKFGLDPKIYMNRMTKVATQQIVGQGQRALASAAKEQAGNLLSGALRAQVPNYVPAGMRQMIGAQAGVVARQAFR